MKDNYKTNITSTAIQSTINGDSFTESLKHQTINTIVMAGANYTANKIGGAYHTGEINKATQLTLHAGLGAITNTLTGNDALSGAIAGVSAEIFGQYLVDHTKLNDNSVKEYSGLFAGITSLIVGKTTNLDSSDIRSNVFSGYRVGKNAVENNLLYSELLKESRENESGKGKYGKRVHPITQKETFHKGVDIYTYSEDKNIYASADGTVIYTKPQYNEKTGTGWRN